MARFLLVPPVVLPRVARFLLAPPVVLCAGSFRVARRSYCASTASVLPPVYRAPAASVSCAGLPRADSFRIVRRSTARRQLPYCRRSLAVRFLGGAAQCVRAQISIGIWLFQPGPHLWLETVLTVPRAQKKETQARANCSAVPTQLALCLRLAIDL